MQQLEFASKEKSEIARAILKAKKEYETFKAIPRTLAGFMNRALKPYGISYKSPQGWSTLIERAREQVKWEDAMRKQFAEEMKNPQMDIPDEPVEVVLAEETEICASCGYRYVPNQMQFGEHPDPSIAGNAWLCLECHELLRDGLRGQDSELGVESDR